jgi:RNA polymerase sigma-70 factor (ECF subfamily)
MSVEASLGDELLATIPSLRAFAISFTNNRDRAYDLVQETILRAWANIDKFNRART